MKPIDVFLDIVEKFFAPKVNGSKKVLVLENDQYDREALCSIVKSEGFEPVWFVSQYDAEHSMDSIVYAAGIFDLKLMNGSGAKAQATFELKFPEVPNIIVTGDHESVVKITQEGLSVVWKGNDFKSMTRAVRQMLRPIKSNTSSNRWTTQEVLLFLAIIGFTNCGTWYLAELWHTHIKTP